MTSTIKPCGRTAVTTVRQAAGLGHDNLLMFFTRALLEHHPEKVAKAVRLFESFEGDSCRTINGEEYEGVPRPVLNLALRELGERCTSARRPDQRRNAQIDYRRPSLALAR